MNDGVASARLVAVEGEVTAAPARIDVTVQRDDPDAGWRELFLAGFGDTETRWTRRRAGDPRGCAPHRPPDARHPTGRMLLVLPLRTVPLDRASRRGKIAMLRWSDGGVELRLKGFPPIWAHPAALIVPIVLTWHLWAPGERAGLITAAVAVPGIALSVLAHEIGHAAVAKRWGLRTTIIRLLPTGGVAEISGQPESLAVDRQITLAGPAVNLAIGAACLGIAWAFPVSVQPDASATWFDPPPIPPSAASSMVRGLSWTGWANLGLAFFNMLPAIPLDGGQIALGLLAPRLGIERALFWVGSTGVVLGLAAGFLSFVSLLAGVPILLPPPVGDNWKAMRRGRSRPRPR